MVFEHTHYRGYLRAVLDERKRSNPSYTLRAMARALGFTVSHFSLTLSGQAGISVKKGRRIAARLKLSEAETDYLCLLIQLETEKRPEIRSQLLDRLERVRPVRGRVADLTADLFRQMADWYHAAILELVRLPGFVVTPESCARKLGISRLDAQIALDRLERIGFIERNEEGRWMRSEDGLRFLATGKNAALRTFYKQMFEKISVALDEQEPFRERLGGFETRCMAREALPEVSQALERFFEEFTRISLKYPNPKDVYHVGVHCISLTQPKKENENEKKEK